MSDTAIAEDTGRLQSPRPRVDGREPEESRGYELPVLFTTPTLTIIIPTILDFGTEEQKQRYIPAALRGEELWVQFLSVRRHRPPGQRRRPRADHPR